MEAELAGLLVVEAVQLGIRDPPVVSVWPRDVAVERDAHRVDHRPHAILSLCSRNPGRTRLRLSPESADQCEPARRASAVADARYVEEKRSTLPSFLPPMRTWRTRWVPCRTS